MAGMFNIGLSGLNAAQMQLNTTSHNITNAATPGYTRQSAHQVANAPFFSGSGFVGQGTQVTSITRNYSQFLENQVLSSDNRRAEFSAYNAQISQLNNLLADSDVGLSPSMDNFFAAVQEVAANPSDVSARQAMISTGQELATIFANTDARMEEIREGTEGEIAGTVNRVNSLASEIGEFNRQIALAQASSGGQQPNDLLDKRNQTLSELNKLIDTNTRVDSDGQMSVFIGSGQTLVLGESVAQLKTVPDSDDPQRNAIAMVAPNGNEVPLNESLLTGGELGGLLAFRGESLDQAQDQLNRIARQLTEQFNAQHRLGVDLEDQFGLDFFNASMVQRDGGTGESPMVSIENDRLLPNGEFSLVVTDATDPAGFELRNADGNLIDPADIGLAIQLPDGAENGDSFTIEPLSNAAGNMSVANSDPAKLAVAGPVSVEMPLNNQGTGKADDIVMNSRQGMNDGAARFDDFRLVFDDGDLTVDGDGIDPAEWQVSPDSFNPANDSSGRTITVTHDDGWSFDFRLSGSPQDGDAFAFSPNVGGVADNRNAVALGELQTARTMLNSGNDNRSTASFQGAFGQMVSQVGNKTREVQTGEQTQQAMLQQAEQARESLSGVNLDEEAANLMRYQQAYQASGRIMTVAQRLFDEIIAIGR